MTQLKAALKWRSTNDTWRREHKIRMMKKRLHNHPSFKQPLSDASLPNGNSLRWRKRPIPKQNAQVIWIGRRALDAKNSFVGFSLAAGRRMLGGHTRLCSMARLFLTYLVCLNKHRELRKARSAAIKYHRCDGFAILHGLALLHA